MFYHFNDRGAIHVTKAKINLHIHPKFRGANYPSADLAHQAWIQWINDYLEHCFTLGAPSNRYHKYRFDYES